MSVTMRVVGADSVPVPQPSSRPRPPLFRALGPDEPPAEVEIDGEPFRCIEVLKLDSWAASGIYASPTRRTRCKFNRRQRVAVVPMGWLGRLLAAREQSFHDRLHGIAGIPVSLGPVRLDGRVLPNAIARAFIDGHALEEREWVDDAFFPRLRRLLAEVHRRDVAHVDLHKRENILVADDGRPFLIDFQISFALPRFPLIGPLLRPLLTVLQRSDDYHLLKHQIKHRPDQSSLGMRDLEQLRPWWIRAHRSIAVPFRTCRRQLLVWLGIRSRSGHAYSEAFPEIAHRRAA
ncbi:MAG: hypothetical protein ACKOHG_20600 [Planctomycetia bacterium]